MPGMFAGAETSVMCFELKVGDRLVLMSDGIAEAMNANGQLSGFKRVHELLRTMTAAAEVAGGGAELWAGGRHQRDLRGSDRGVKTCRGIRKPRGGRIGYAWFPPLLKSWPAPAVFRDEDSALGRRPSGRYPIPGRCGDHQHERPPAVIAWGLFHHAPIQCGAATMGTGYSLGRRFAVSALPSAPSQMR